MRRILRLAVDDPDLAAGARRGWGVGCLCRRRRRHYRKTLQYRGQGRAQDAACHGKTLTARTSPAQSITDIAARRASPELVLPGSSRHQCYTDGPAARARDRERSMTDEARIFEDAEAAAASPTLRSRYNQM